MSEEKGNSAVLTIIAIVVLIGAGIGIYALTQDENDEVNEPTTSEVTNQDAEDETQAQEQQNIVETAQSNPELSTLVAAVNEAELAETLSGEGPYTVLAPDNGAFEDAIGELDTTAEELLARENLADILSYHVISGSVMSSDLTDGQTVTTLAGGTLTVDVTDEGVFFVDERDRRARVTTPDVEASNGTVHIINNVLLPGSDS